MYDSTRHDRDVGGGKFEQDAQRKLMKSGGGRAVQKRREELVRRFTRRRANAGKRNFY